jgi:cephalosporin-C deacetylase-like acetyl esterase
MVIDGLMLNLLFRILAAASALLLGGARMAGEQNAKQVTIPWDVAALSRTPEMKWHDRTGLVRSLLYGGEPYQGRPTQVFAYYASPVTIGLESDAQRKFPGVVLVHGGGGTAFAKWAEIYAKNGYAAIAMDLGGKWLPDPSNTPEKSAVRLPDGGPAADDTTKFAPTEPPHRDQWTYHAVANVLLAHSLLRSFPEVDLDRVGVTGISWGGYLTCIVAGVDSRFRSAVPQYGCGFLSDNSAWKKTWFESPKHGREWAEQWIKLWDPSNYVASAKMPILFVNGAQDFAYPLDSYAKTYHLVRSEKNISVQPKLGHGHMFEVKEVHLFLDAELKGGAGLPRVKEVQASGGRVAATMDGTTAIKRATLEFTTGPHAENRTRTWVSIPMEIEGRMIKGDAAPPEATVWYISVEDERGALVSSELQIAH